MRTKRTPWIIRPFTTPDLANVLEIDAAGYQMHATQADLEAYRLRPDSLLMVASHPAPRRRAPLAVGFYAATYLEDFDAAGREWPYYHLDRLAVDPDNRRRGVAAALLADLVARLKTDEPRPRQKAVAYIDEDNLPAQLCARAAGWRCTGATEPCTPRPAAAAIAKTLYRFEYRLSWPSVKITNRLT